MFCPCDCEFWRCRLRPRPFASECCIEGPLSNHRINAGVAEVHKLIPNNRSGISSTHTTTSTIWTACVALWRKARPSSPTTITGPFYQRVVLAAVGPARLADAKGVCTERSGKAGTSDVHLWFGTCKKLGRCIDARKSQQKNPFDLTN
jgi:hypothetical protein